jgi:hypothetical protein
VRGILGQEICVELLVFGSPSFAIQMAFDNASACFLRRPVLRFVWYCGNAGSLQSEGLILEGNEAEALTQMPFIRLQQIQGVGGHARLCGWKTLGRVGVCTAGQALVGRLLFRCSCALDNARAEEWRAPALRTCLRGLHDPGVVVTAAATDRQTCGSEGTAA